MFINGISTKETVKRTLNLIGASISAQFVDKMMQRGEGIER